MRGKGLQGGLLPAACRITPAYAGKSTKSRSAIRLRWDHPRVCGEKASALSAFGVKLGSPPRVRGKACFFACFRPGVGITPACAGKSQPAHDAGRAGPDHPRVCGEKWLNLMNEKREQGSPPRMRGKVRCTGLHHLINGITPAYAGKSSGPMQRSGTSGDHPRVCGEKYVPYH